MNHSRTEMVGGDQKEQESGKWQQRFNRSRQTITTTRKPPEIYNSVIQVISTANFCNMFAVLLQRRCSGAANVLQYHCKGVAELLQTGVQ